MRQMIPVILALAALSGASPASDAAGLADATLEGRWSLVEQRYGEGQHDFAREDGAITVVFSLERGALQGVVSWDRGRDRWPAYPTPDGPAPVTETSRTVSPDLSRVEARYRVPSREPGGTDLLVHERWRLTDADRAEVRVEITFERRGEQRGSFAWRRVFVREEGP
jgi:hypothetical protein